MKLFLMNILLAISWCALTADASLANFLAGFVVGYAAMAMSPVRKISRGYFRRLPRILGLLVFFLKELVASGLRATMEVLSPVRKSQPRVIRVDTELRERNHLLLLSQLISLTPGTLVLDVDPEEGVLYVHAMFAHSEQAFLQELRGGMERRVREVFD
ncbi:Na+/H+ antiporter subunit E [Microbulbifer salipaludis]|uniref:Na+/H+ antiporter subunit E n=1 Tax=Microbulbifer salipaludis TaxID=187980 RepID=A0ABS3E474_9GAMM|nr:Na+/H+ antiporter subunit E [Microbulbifer salipaludis]MBN8430077.1 Na+/H+ antiporter subunit E [Microbulbifer salipaludis]